MTKIAGIVGGIGPESTVEYYRLIIASYREQQSDGSFPSIIINSIDLKKMVALVTAGDLAGVTDYVLQALERLARAGADFAALAANTPHIVFNEVQKRSTLPLISIVETACAEAQARGLKRVGIFGTHFTMQGRFYPDIFSRAGIQIAAPDEDEQTYIHTHYMDELINGVFLPETRSRLLEIVDQMRERERIDSVILGGTELSLILRDGEHNGVPFLDTTKIHVNRIVAELLA